MDNSTRLATLGTEVARLVEDGMTVGLGTGSTAAAMVEALGERVREGLRLTGVPTSIETSQQARRLGIPLKELSDVDRLDLCIDGADEIDPGLNLVKGRGGALLYEKLVARRADRYVIISSDEKLVERLGTRMPLPVEIVPVGWRHTSEYLADLGLRPELRLKGDETPFQTDGGNFILDCGWPEANEVDPGSLAHAVKALTGVIDHGIFLKMAHVAYIIDEDGEIKEHTAR